MSHATPRVSYVGIYPPTIARNAVALKGLRLEGVQVREYVVEGSVWKKIWSLIRILRTQRTTTDIWLVGYLSEMIVPFVRLFGAKPVIYNAGNSFYESIVLDRAKIKLRSFKGLKIWFFDWLSFVCADLVLVESIAQKMFFQRYFYLPEKKLRVVLTGADDTQFFSDASVIKRQTFSIGFRGGLLPATGVECIIEAAEYLKDEPIDFYLYGRGMLLTELKQQIARKGLSRVFLDERFLDTNILRTALLSCHVLLGQFSSHPRLERTIQNKTFETLALRMPFITLQTISNKELLMHEASCFFIDKPDPQLLAKAILRLKSDTNLQNKLAAGAAVAYEEKASPRAIGRVLRRIIQEKW